MRDENGNRGLRNGPQARDTIVGKTISTKAEAETEGEAEPGPTRETLTVRQPLATIPRA